VQSRRGRLGRRAGFFLTRAGIPARDECYERNSEIMKIRPKTIWTMSLSGECQTDARTEVRVRGLSVTLDEPVNRGGTNQGLMPMETLMAALVGCTNVITHKIAKANEIEIEEMSVRVDATVNSAGTRLEKEIDIPFPEVTLHIDLTTGAGDGEVELLKTNLRRHCAISKVLQQAGTTVNEVWTVKRP
jgi:uncharacterized OsmC-like protein